MDLSETSKPEPVEAVIEIPRGSRNKYEMDHDTGKIWLDRTLFTATEYPADYGFIEGTLGEDGDPLDVMVILQDKTFPGCRILVRPVAVFWMRDEAGPDAKILAVPAKDVRYEEWQDISSAPPFLLREIEHFFNVYKDLEPSKQTDVRGWDGRQEAEDEIAAARKRLKTTG